MKVLIVDSDSASRRWVRRILEESVVHEVGGETGDPDEVLEIARRTAPDIVVLSDEIASQDRTLVSELTTGSEATVILIAVTSGGRMVWLGMTDGARGYLLKDRLHSELGIALDAAQAGGTFVSPPLVRQLVHYLHDRFSSHQEGFSTDEISRRLLPREYETLYRLAAGQSTDEIADGMSVATATVRAYVSRVLRKFGLRSRGEAIALAYRSGLYAPGQETEGVPPSTSASQAVGSSRFLGVGP
jgi:DNA-binding NarL/FixJ family response regulator